MLFLSEDKVKGIAKCIVKGMAECIAEDIAEDQAEDWAKGWAKGRALENLMLFLSEEEIREKCIVGGIAEGIAKGMAECIAEDIAENWAEDWAEDWIIGVTKGKIEMIQSLIKNGQSKEFILTLSCTEEEYKMAEEALQNHLELTERQGSFLKGEIEKAKLHEEWRREYVMLLLHDEEKIEEGIAKERIEGIQRLIKNGQSKEFIINLGYTEEDYKKAQEALLETV